MSTAGRSQPEDAPAASEVAAACRDAGLVRIVAAADGDALAATGLLARALGEAGVPFQASVTRLPRPGGTEADATVTVGAPGGDLALTGTTSPTAFETARVLGADPDPALALAGVTAAGGSPGAHADLLEVAGERGVERRPGVAVPTRDLADGLAHTTLAHAAFSGDPDAARTALADRGLSVEADDGAGGRQAASLVALATARGGSDRGAEAVERALHPYVCPAAPFATVGGYGDVLDAVARDQPGTGVALALGYDARAPALSAWRAHARRAHAAVRSADTGRYAGVVVARTEGPVGTVARLLRDFRSPEPVVLAIAGAEAAAAGVEPVAPALEAAAAAVGAAAAGRTTTGYARGIDDAEAFVAAFREALS